MIPIVRNILAVVVGIVIGSAVNMALIKINGFVIPPPEGADVTTMEGLQQSIHLFQPKHFLFPLLAHAMGSLVTAFVAVSLSNSHSLALAAGLGLFSLAGGAVAVYMIPAPVWFSVTDLVFAYVPMSLLGWKLSKVVRSI